MAAVENAYAPAPALGEEMGPIIAALKEGSAMTRYYSKNKTPDLRIFMLKMEEFQVVWCRTGKEGGRLEGSGITNTKSLCWNNFVLIPCIFRRLFVALLCSFILLLFAVFIREIKEVRRGLGSKDFDRNPETARRLDPNCCLAIFYGSEFKLKTLSLVGKWAYKLNLMSCKKCLTIIDGRLNLLAELICISLLQPIVLKRENSGLEDWCIWCTKVL